MDKETLRQKANELRDAANKAYEDFNSGRITEAEFDQTMEHCEKENERNGVLFKNKQRANQFAAPGPGTIAEGAQDPDQPPDGVREYRQQYSKMSRAANPKTKDRCSSSFNFGLKSYFDRDDIALKTGMPIGPYQGVTNMTGVNASGTTPGSALSAGQYFLTGTAGPAVEPEFVPGIVEMRFFPTVIESLFPTLPVSSPVVTYVAETSWTNAAAATGEGATKPTSAHGLTRYTEQVGKIANLERTTDEMIQDAAYVWALFQRRLVMGVQRRTEVELLAGTGYPGINGLLGRSASFTAPQTVSAVSNVPIPPSIGGPFGAGMGSSELVSSVTPGRSIVAAAGAGNAPTGNDIAIGILNMLVDIRTLTFFEPDAVVVNPMDYLTLRLATDKNGQYFGGSFWGRDYGYPNDQGQLTAGGVDTFGLWGKKLVSTPVMPAGLILVGDFADAGSVLRIAGLRVDVTNLNGTDFEQNMWTARAEARVGLLIERPYLFELGVITTSGAWSS
jgi:HK97 family phage major capsid protein